jgi:hypothetical protein
MTTLSRAAFLIRIWEEPREIAEQPPLWRGTIEHLDGGERIYFQDFDSMVAFIRRLLEEQTTQNKQEP